MASKIDKEGQACPNCQTPVEKRTTDLTKKKFGAKQTNYYKWFFQCPNCKYLYMPPEALTPVPEQQPEAQQSLF